MSVRNRATARHASGSVSRRDSGRQGRGSLDEIGGSDLAVEHERPLEMPLRRRTVAGGKVAVGREQPDVRLIRPCSDRLELIGGPIEISFVDGARNDAERGRVARPLVEIVRRQTSDVRRPPCADVVVRVSARSRTIGPRSATRSPRPSDQGPSRPRSGSRMLARSPVDPSPAGREPWRPSCHGRRRRGRRGQGGHSSAPPGP